MSLNKDNQGSSSTKIVDKGKENKNAEKGQGSRFDVLWNRRIMGMKLNMS